MSARAVPAVARSLRLLLVAFVVLAPAAAAPADRTNLPLKNWGGFAVYRDAVYDDLERLVTAGLADRTLLSTKPLSRIEAARIVARAIAAIRNGAGGAYDDRRDLEPVLARLTEEFRSELASLGVRAGSDLGPAPGAFSLVPVDHAQVGGAWASKRFPLVDSQGRTFKEGANGHLTFDSRAQVGDWFSLYVQPELLANEDYTAARLVTGYAKLTLFNIELMAGRDSLWWGPALHGSLILSNNATPLDQVRIGSAEPFLLPWIGQWVGPTKLLLFVAELEKRRDDPHARMAGMRLTVSPLSFLELGLSRVVMFGGDTKPQPDFGDFLRVMFDPPAGDDRVAEPQLRSNNLFAIDADFRFRNVDKYYLPTRDLRIYGEFGWDDTCCESNFIPLREAVSQLVGVHAIGLFGIDGLEARAEYAETSRFSFTHDQFTSGYWTEGSVISHFAGTDGRDLYGRLTYRLSPTLMLGLEVDRAVIGNTSAGHPEPKERRTGGGIDLSYRFWDRYSLFAQYLVADVENRNFKSGDDGVDHLLRFELTRSFR